MKNGYGFISRHDTQEGVFVHQTAIPRNNPCKFERGVGEGETIEFHVVQGEQGTEAANVSGCPSGGKPLCCPQPPVSPGILYPRPSAATTQSEGR